jgi:ATP-dependent Clp protease adapter protein ClpS
MVMGRDLGEAAMALPDLREVNAKRSPMFESGPTSPHSIETPLFKELLLNDDETPMAFVVRVIETIFGKSRDEAVTHYAENPS